MKAILELDLLALRTFQVLYDTRSIRISARQLKREPSSVSRLLKAFEDAIGAKLFERSAKGLSPTPDGHRVSRKVGELLRRIEDLVPGPENLDAAVPLNVATTNFLAQSLLPDCARRLIETHATFRLRILELFPDQMLLPGINGSFDLGVHPGQLDWPDAWRSVSLGRLRWSLYARTDHPLVSRVHPISLKRVLAFPFVSPFDFDPMRGAFPRSDRFPIALEKRIVGTEVQRADLGLEIVCVTDQLIFAPDVAARRLVDAGRVRRIEAPGVPPFEVDLFLTVREASVPQSLFVAFGKAIKAALAD